MVQFIRGMPIVLDESAWIDGCGRFRIFTAIIFRKHLVQGISTTGLKT